MDKQKSKKITDKINYLGAYSKSITDQIVVVETLIQYSNHFKDDYDIEGEIEKYLESIKTMSKRMFFHLEQEE